MKNTKPKVRLWSVLTGLTAILTVAAIVGNIIANQYATTINVALNASTYKIIHGENTGDTEYFKKGFASDEEREAYEAELCATVEAEGAALLKNENNALPLASGAKVSLFGHGSVDLMYGGTGSGSVDTSKAPNLKQALEAQGITINQTLWDLYSSDSMMSKYSRMTPASISDTLEANTQYAVNEAPWSALSSAESSFAEYGDAAIVVLSRSGGEGADLPSGENGTSDNWISGQEGDGNYLALSAEEIELLQNLKALKDNGTFKKIVVLINSSNAIELDFLNPEICGEDYGIDAAMWIGDVGQTGINGVGQLLSGAVTPSGSLVDTYLYDNMANPAMYNFYTQAYPNAAEYNLLTEGADVQGMYSVYQEGIYLGYCSATSFLRNWDSILEKKRANLRSISEPARLRQPPPRSTGSAHARGRAQSIREERRIAAPPVLFALLWVRLLSALYGPFCGPLRPFGGCPRGVTPSP